LRRNLLNLNSKSRPHVGYLTLCSILRTLLLLYLLTAVLSVNNLKAAACLKGLILLHLHLQQKAPQTAETARKSLKTAPVTANQFLAEVSVGLGDTKLAERFAELANFEFEARHLIPGNWVREQW
jgi:hypothetical protein